MGGVGRIEGKAWNKRESELRFEKGNVYDKGFLLSEE